ncbi:hypothetical protein [Aliivibrio salmonicida]|uniref:hypothetical protein n=1 Tax=Aliivibrio salmonicida TaxID=40269 RepID=UPI003D0BA27B
MVSRLMTGVIVGVTLFSSSPTFAVSEDECNIWMCAPTGFSDSACKGAKKAFKKRTRRGKPPLPEFSRCSVLDEQVPNGTQASEMTYIDGVSAVIKETQQCTGWSGSNSNNRYCATWTTIPQHLVKGVSCSRDKDGKESPKNCISTVKWIETYMDGELFGDIFYYR